ncbi:MAG: hypothetical protein J7L04_06805 [Bacteroidales bacterium]|nr:hypothetical protein [Bacteroidales bacterium]
MIFFKATISFTSVFLLSTIFSFAQIKLRYENNETLQYDEIISAYQYLDKTYAEAKLFEVGLTDIGKPLHLFVISKDQDFNSISIHAKEKCVIFINNGIHPGEPPGIDASIQFSEDLLSGKYGMNKLLENTVICIVPVYNVGGCLNRSPYHRTNQDTPPESGFRGNGKNLDLNRDFIKMDSRNARSLIKAFHKWKPEVFLDTHVTNGSDHQYVITLISTVFQRLPEPMSKFFKEKMVPDLFTQMSKTPYEMTPYVNWLKGGSNPDKGIAAYFDAPRVSTGFASMFNTYAFMTENHVYKEFKDQTKSVYYFIKALVSFSNKHSKEIIRTKNEADNQTLKELNFISKWKLDMEHKESLIFKGYEGSMINSQLTGLKVYHYDQSRPYEKEIPFYQNYLPEDTLTKPEMYIIPQAWEKAIKYLQLNDVKLERLSKDMEVEVEAYTISSFKFSSRPNNGHFRINDIQTIKEKQKIKFYKGDYIVKMNQETNRFIMEVLEPVCVDSYLSWNFFDPVFDRREYFSPSGFEDKALHYLDENPDLKKEFEKKKLLEPDFATNNYAQFSYIYNHSPYLAKSYKRYPVYRIEREMELPVR